MRRPPKHNYISQVPFAPFKGEEVVLTDIPWMKYCNGCKKDHPAIEFGWHADNHKGIRTTRIRSRCHVAIARDAREASKAKSQEHVMRVAAPLEAAIELLKNNPEAFARFVQQNRYEYEGYLIKAREMASDRYNRYSEAGRRKRDAELGKFQEDEAA